MSAYLRHLKAADGCTLLPVASLKGEEAVENQYLCKLRMYTACHDVINFLGITVGNIH